MTIEEKSNENAQAADATQVAEAAAADERLEANLAMAFDEESGVVTPTPAVVPDPDPTPDPNEAVKVPATEAVKAEAGQTLDEMAEGIPPHLLRGAMHQSQFNQLSPQQLMEFWHKDPVAAEPIFQGYYEAMNQSNAQAAEAGRQASNVAVTNPPATLPEMVGYDIESLAADMQVPVEVAERFAAPVMAVLENAKAMQAELGVQRDTARKQQLAAIATTVQDFFTADSMKSFSDFYGKEFDFQNPNIINVMTQADAIQIGCRAQNIEITAEESLRRAHDMLTASFVGDRIRREIKDSLTQRAKGATLRPSHKSGQAVASEDAKDQRLTQGLADVFG